MPARIINTHTQHEKNLMARGKATRAKAAAKRQQKRQADLLDTTVGAGGTDTTPAAQAAPPAPPPTRNQAQYRMLTKQLRLKQEMVTHWTQIHELARKVDETGVKAIHALVQREQTENEIGVWERKLAEILKQDPDADK